MAHALPSKLLSASSVFLCALGAYCLIAIFAGLGSAQGQSDRNRGFDVKSSVGDMHLGNDADARKIGLPVYPGARERKHDEHRNSANLSLFTSEFGIKLVVLNYDSDDAPSKVIAYYRDKLKKYGKVLECRTSNRDRDVNPSTDKDDSQKSKELKCEGDQKGDTIELKVGTEDNQHLVAVSPAENGGEGSTFALVYVRARGKQADI